MSTLVVDLDSRIRRSPRFKTHTLKEYWTGSKLRWWKPTDPAYVDQGRTIKKWLETKHFESALEIGPGFGRITKLFAKISSRVVLLEINRKASKLLRERFGDATVINADFLDFGFPNNTFDLAVAVDILVHIPDIEMFVNKVAACLKTNGQFITSITPLRWYEKNKVRRTIIHRGIDEGEFEHCVSRFFDMEAIHTSKNGQLITYLLRKK